MPQRRSTRGLLLGGVFLVGGAVACVSVPYLWERDIRIARLARERAEVMRLDADALTIRDVVDTLRDARAAALDFLLNGAPSARLAFSQAAEQAEPLVAEASVRGTAIGASAVFRDESRQLLAMLRIAMDEAPATGRATAARHLLDNSQDLVHALDEARDRDLAAIDRDLIAIIDHESAADSARDHRAIAYSAVAGAALMLGLFALAAYRRRILTADEQLRASRDAALEASVAKSRFVAIISHDLRQPLHAISMFVGVLRRRVGDQGVHKVLDNLDSAVGSMQRMFATLLDVARLDAGAIDVKHEDVALQPLFDTLSNEFGGSAVAKGLTLAIRPTPLAVVADFALLETILRNLLSNAVKFTEHGRIDVAARPDNGAVAIEVRDTGIGIPLAEQERVFEQFERGSAGGRGREGLGLGLSIVLRMAHMIDAGLRLDSAPGEGSSFVVTLPPAAAPPAAGIGQTI